MVYFENLTTNTDLNGKIGTVREVSGDQAFVAMNKDHNGRLKQVKVAKCRRLDIMPMAWGANRSVVEPAFYEKWSDTIAKNDRKFWSEHAFNGGQSDVYRYIELRVQQVVQNKRAIGEAGWSFKGADMDSVIHCLLWSNGSKDQETPLTTPRSDESWWPCIVIRSETTMWPCYCPGLAWQLSRPWYVHVSRIQYISRL